MKRLLFLILTALALLPVHAQPLPPPMAPIDPSLLRAAEANGTIRVMVKFDVPVAGRTPQEAADAIRLFRLGLLSSTRGGVARFAANSETWTIPYAAIETDANGLRALAAVPGVVAISLDALEERHLQSALPVINVDDAHARGTGDGYSGLVGKGWTVVILDDGIQANHPFFDDTDGDSRVVNEACFSSNNPSQGGTSLCPNGQDVQLGPGSASTSVCGSQCNHGTHVAGIAAGYDDENTANRGVAPGANIIMITVFGRYGADVSTAVSDQVGALQHITNTLSGQYKIASVNMSLGGGLFSAACDSDGDATQQARIDAINLLTASGIGVVISSGNNGNTTQISRPGCISSAITVSAITDGGVVASFSNSNGLVDFYAPGDNITSSGLSSSFFEQEGTSMAAPFVAGALAVLKQAAPNAPLGELVNALTATGQTITDLRPGATLANQAPLIKVDLAIDVLRGDADYAYNGDFEAKGADNKTPDGWTRAGGAKRKCNTPTKTFTIHGDCAVQMKVDATGTAKLTHVVDAPRGLYDDTLTLRAKVNAKNVASGKVMLKIKLVTNVMEKVKLNFNGTFDWEPDGDLSSPPFVLNDTVKKLTVIASATAGGKYMLDDVQVELDKVPVEVP